MMKLYGYFRSSAAYRVRIALHYKKIPYELVPVHLVKDGGQQFNPDYLALNSQGLVPSLQLADGKVLTQSLAIIEYLEEEYPTPALLPTASYLRAEVRSLALQIACEIHPVNNLRILKYLTNTLTVTDDVKTDWYQHWVALGFHAFEKKLLTTAGQYCVGDEFTVADLTLVPQVYNALRFNCPLDDYPLIQQIYQRCLLLPAVQASAPEAQPDFS